MGALLDLLKSDEFRRHTALFVGTYRFDVVAPWVRGFAFAVEQICPERPDDLAGFCEWLVVRFHGGGSLGWDGILRREFGDSDETTKRFFELLDEFLDDLGHRGLSAILDEHKRFEIKKYGRSETP